MSHYRDLMALIASGDAEIISDEPLTLNLGTAAPTTPKSRRNKYNAKPVSVDGLKFDSRAEYERWLDLKSLQADGKITGLQLHPRFELQPAFTSASGQRYRAITYTADFEYMRDGVRVIEDVKGNKATQTRDFVLRWKILAYLLRDDADVSLEVFTPNR